MCGGGCEPTGRVVWRGGVPLTAEQYDQLIEVLGSRARPQSSSPPHGGEERRQTPRSSVRGPAELRVRTVGGTRCVTAYVQDVSAGGVGLLSATSVLAGANVELLLSNSYDDVVLRCSVRHCTPLAPGLYGVGLDVSEFQSIQGRPESPAAEASAAWAGFFGNG